MPSKLLIQMPRFGKKFKAFQKIIPNKTLNVTRITDSLCQGYFCSVLLESVLKLLFLAGVRFNEFSV